MYRSFVCLSSLSSAFPAARTRTLTPLSASTGPDGVTTIPTPVISYWRKPLLFADLAPTDEWKYVYIQLWRYKSLTHLLTDYQSQSVRHDNTEWNSIVKWDVCVHSSVQFIVNDQRRETVSAASHVPTHGVAFCASPPPRLLVSPVQLFPPLLSSSALPSPSSLFPQALQASYLHTVHTWIYLHLTLDRKNTRTQEITCTTVGYSYRITLFNNVLRGKKG